MVARHLAASHDIKGFESAGGDEIPSADAKLGSLKMVQSSVPLRARETLF
jgi:hypothetical protein